MTLDLVALGVTGAFAAWGYHAGAVRQLAHVIGLAAAFFLSKPAAAALSPQTRILPAVLFPFLFLGGSLVSRLALNLIEPGEERGPLDQGLGVAVGAAKGAALLFLLLSFVLSLGPTRLPKDSKAVDFVRARRL